MRGGGVPLIKTWVRGTPRGAHFIIMQPVQHCLHRQHFCSVSRYWHLNDKGRAVQLPFSNMNVPCRNPFQAPRTSPWTIPTKTAAKGAPWMSANIFLNSTVFKARDAATWSKILRCHFNRGHQELLVTICKMPVSSLNNPLLISALSLTVSAQWPYCSASHRLGCPSEVKRAQAPSVIPPLASQRG